MRHLFRLPSRSTRIQVDVAIAVWLAVSLAASIVPLWI